MKILLFIGTGGFIGTVFRYILTGVPYKMLDTTFPLGTLLVNFLGACLIGYFMEFSLSRSYISDTTRMFVAIGILGGFTTFSTFSYETIALLRAGNFFDGFLNMMLTNGLCLGGTFCGMKLVTLLTKGF